MPIVWVVEDQPFQADALAEFIEGIEGYFVVKFYDAKEPISTLEYGTFDYAIVDLSLPHPGGEEVIKQMRTKCPNSIIIATSGYDVRNVDGADRFLNKPLVTDYLSRILRNE